VNLVFFNQILLSLSYVYVSNVPYDSILIVV